MEIRRRINKDKWTLKIVTHREMKKVADGDDSVCGLCVANEKTIYIREDSVEYSTVAHEVFHAFWSYLHLSDTKNIELDDAEEIGASMFAADGEEMVRKSKRFTKALKKLQERNEE